MPFGRYFSTSHLKLVHLHLKSILMETAFTFSRRRSNGARGGTRREVQGLRAVDRDVRQEQRHGETVLLYRQVF